MVDVLYLTVTVSVGSDPDGHVTGNYVYSA